MGILLGSNFDMQTGLPLDSRLVVANISARDALPSSVRYQGMIVYSIADIASYQLQGGILNSNWNTYGGGSSSAFVKDVFNGNGSTVTFNLGADPISIDNTFIYVSGIYQQKSTYSISTTVLTFSTPPPAGSSIEVIYGTSLTSFVPADNSISSSKLLNNSITQSKKEIRSVGTTVGAGGLAVSNACVSYSTTSSSYADVTNLTVTITTLGNPVVLTLKNDEPLNFSYILLSKYANTASANVFLQRNTDDIGLHTLEISIGGATSVSKKVPPGSIQFIDTPVAGTYTYKILAATISSATLTFTNIKLTAREL